MTRNIQTDGVRGHELSDRKVRCPNARTYGADAKTGNWITYNTSPDADITAYASGRMLGCVNAPFIAGDRYPCQKIENYLSVLVLSHDLTFAYIRWIKPEDVTNVSDCPPVKLLAFITGPMPDALTVHKLAHYGTLSEHYADGIPERIAAFKANAVR